MAAKDVIFKIQAIDKATKPIQNVKKGFKGADQSANSLNKTVKNVGSTIKKAFAAFAIFQAAKEVVTLGANMEQTRVAFATFLGDANKANEVIAKLNEFSNVTPFNNAEVIKSGRLLLAAGLPAENLTNHLKAIGDVAAGSNVPLEELTAIFQKGFSKGKIQGETLDQFAERGINIIPALGKALGVAGEKVREMGSKGLITRDHLVTAFKSMTSEGGQFFNLMEKQSKTLGGRFSTLVGTLQTVGIGIGEALIGPLGKVVDVMQFVVGFIREKATNIITIFRPLGDAIQPLLDTFKEIGAEIGLIGDGAGFLENVFNVLGNVIKFLSPLLKGAFTVVGAILKGLFAVGRALINMFQRFTFLQKLTTGLVMAFKSVFQNLKKAAITALGGIADLVTGILTGDLDKIKGAFSQLGEAFVAGNPVSVGIDAGKGFAKGYKRGIKEGDFTDFFGPDPTGEIAKAGAVATTSAALAGSASLPSATPKGNLKAGISEVAAAAPKTFNINIGSLIEGLQFNTTNLEDSKNRIQEEVTQVLLTVLRDAEIQSGV